MEGGREEGGERESDTQTKKKREIQEETGVGRYKRETERER